MTVAKSSRIPFNKRLQQDSVRVAGKTIFINPFLYWKRFDENTDRWLREPGQMGGEQIESNRTRFYPELDWALLSKEEILIKDAAIEMFLKTLELIGTFHPELNAGQMLEVERKMSITKKEAFEKWVKKSFAKRNRLQMIEKNRFQRERFLRNWSEWITLEATHQAFFPFIVIIFVSLFMGWSAGISKNSCAPFFDSNNSSFIN